MPETNPPITPGAKWVSLVGRYANAPAADGTTELEVRELAGETQLWLSGVSLSHPWGPERASVLPGPPDWRQIVRFLADEDESIGLPSCDYQSVQVAGIGGAPAILLAMAWCTEGGARPVAKAIASLTDDQLNVFLRDGLNLALPETVSRIESVLERIADLGYQDKSLGELVAAVGGARPLTLPDFEEVVGQWEALRERELKANEAARLELLRPFEQQIADVVDRWKSRQRSSATTDGPADLDRWGTLLASAIEDYVLAHGSMPANRLTVHYPGPLGERSKTFDIPEC